VVAGDLRGPAEVVAEVGQEVDRLLVDPRPVGDLHRPQFRIDDRPQAGFPGDVVDDLAGRAAKGRLDESAERAVRRACRDAFRRTRLLERIIPTIEQVLSAAGVAPPEPPEDAQPPQFDDHDPEADPGTRAKA
jgi:hypothetical protein